MSQSAQKQISLTRSIPFPNQYIQALYSEYGDWVFDEVSAVQFRGQWRKLFFKNEKTPLHLEIGPGNGKHFVKLCLNRPKDCFLSIELKYKPLIQTIKRVRQNNCRNGKAIRYNASLTDNLFEQQELNNIYLHFPDPWLKKRRQKKHQLIQKSFCKKIYNLQKPHSFLELKTDSKNYFVQSVQLLKNTGYQIHKYSLNLHKDQKPEKEFMDNLSQFELLFFQKKIPIKCALFVKPPHPF